MILAATSGDTGGALLSGMEQSAIDGLLGVVLLPAEGTSFTQKKQMLSFRSQNVRVFQIDGDFDFCQQFVKRFLAEYTPVFSAEYFMLLTVANSISWPRLVAQIVMHSNAYLEAANTGNCNLMYLEL